MLEKNFKNIISNIKEEIINTQIKTMQEVAREDFTKK